MSVDIFCLCSHYTDLASLGPIAHYTCGQVGFRLSLHTCFLAVAVVGAQSHTCQ
jgi:Sec23/Sec24 trunk domain